MDVFQLLIIFSGAVLFLFLIFLVCRDITCWYLKTTKISDTLERMESLESEMLETLKKIEKKE